MPRKAREKAPFGTYYIEQSCILEKKIFKSDNDRKNFIEILKEKKEQFNFKIYGYCLADDKKYKLIIYSNGSDISKIMKAINISLAYSIKKRGKIFTNRYKSSLIKSPEELENILNTLHNHSHCCEFEFNEVEKLIDFEIYFTPIDGFKEQNLVIDKETNEICIKINPSCKDTSKCIRDMTQGIKAIEEFAKKYNLTKDELLSNKTLRNQELLNFRKMSTLSLRELGILFGGLSESAVCKIISRNKQI